VVVNYQTPTETIRSVEALCASRRPVDQIVVVDNGSKDGSAAILERALPHALHISLGDNLGFSGGYNRGIDRVLGDGAELILIVNSDARVRPDAVGALEAALVGDPALGIVGPAVLRADGSAQVESVGISFSRWTGRMRVLEGKGPVDPSASPRVDAVSGCVMLVRRRVFETIGLFAEEYFFSFEDVDLCARARGAGFSVACINAAQVEHEGSSTMGSRTPRHVYFATRNHLHLVAQHARPLVPPLRAVRQAYVVALNLAHALTGKRSPVLPGLAAFGRALLHHRRGHYGGDGR
jgi:GT2 family glycosyltransferase